MSVCRHPYVSALERYFGQLLTSAQSIQADMFRGYYGARMDLYDTEATRIMQDAVDALAKLDGRARALVTATEAQERRDGSAELR